VIWGELLVEANGFLLGESTTAETNTILNGE